MGVAIASARKSSRGRPRVDATPVNVRLPPEQLANLDAWIADQPDPKPSRPEAVRHALADWLAAQGYVQDRDDPEGAN
jgi:Arc/MetJ-type ribon-helix-helix transcriptional regulator